MERNISDGRLKTKAIAARRVATVAASFNAATYSGVLPIVVFGVYVGPVFQRHLSLKMKGRLTQTLTGRSFRIAGVNSH